jgi:CHAD domain-containing protein
MADSASQVAAEVLVSEADQIKEQAPQGAPPDLATIISERLKALVAHQRVILETGDPDAIHKFRVTTRRLQIALEILPSDVDNAIRHWRKQLRRWRRSLSTLRNYDVFHHYLEKEARSFKGLKLTSIESLQAIFQERRRKGLARAQRRLGQIRIQDIATALAPHAAAIQSSPGFGASALAASVGLEQKLIRLESLAVLSHAKSKMRQIHRLRIAAKRVRYLMELYAALGYKDSERPLGWLRQLQDRLGEWHDVSALEEQIICLASRRKFIRRHIEEASQLLQFSARLRSRKEAMSTKFFPVRVPRTITGPTRRLALSLRRQPNVRSQSPKEEILDTP